MSCLLVRTFCEDGSFVLPESILKSSFGPPSITESTRAIQTVRKVEVVTAGKVVDFVGKHIHKPVYLGNAVTMATTVTRKVAHSFAFV